MRRSVALVGDAAVISGRPARLIADFVRKRAEDVRTLDPEVREALQALAFAGRKRPDQEPFRRVEAAAGGRMEVEGQQVRTVDATEAGHLLGVGARRVRQLRTAGLLDPVSIGRPMRFDRRAVEALAEERTRACSTI